MIKEVMTANKAVAEAVRLAKPQVIPVYPITPQTTISEYLAQYVADEKIDAKYVKVESEHSAISAAVGASGAGVRTFTATSSQGLMLMHEILFAAAGMRTPIVLADANRAISAPLNIWNDQQDSIAQRDAGWLQIYVENAQEALDIVIDNITNTLIENGFEFVDAGGNYLLVINDYGETIEYVRGIATIFSPKQ